MDTHRCAVCGGPFLVKGEPMFCEFCPSVYGEPEDLPELPDDEG